ncbi:uncharacterized protein G2W53_041781 [Senna tora]|uniref:Uncharacterized protein n=1 Tax=Senna tora TaxID=362788 RepID=A0A834SE48_9FABA|nr:uncharacterized protein G2W53_041681 [Senna tora]KAF7802574.1 uncharacterized protein G2W53_041685 [Senna tora]KAF7802670.1 uncharacterized protein G2W53_041781 [Senna tora]
MATWHKIKPLAHKLEDEL